jgi:ADP-heptose:LPS heptosyltransferase
MCGIIKATYPEYKVSFLGNSYTKEVIEASTHIDDFVNVDLWTSKSDENVIEELKELKVDAIIHVFPNKKIASLAQRAGIKERIGTRNRIFHWLTCNRLIDLSRRNSSLHEAQLNLRLLKPLNIANQYKVSELHRFYGFSHIAPLTADLKTLLSDTKFNLIIHPKSRGSAMEWSLSHYSDVIKKLDPEKFKIFISGSDRDNNVLTDWIKEHTDRVTDVTGKFTLKQFLEFVNCSDGLLASSTGPLHLAAALGIHALGLYANSASVNASRWCPVGNKAEYLEAKSQDVNLINPDIVTDRILNWI